jgi:hypothetical protein
MTDLEQLLRQRVIELTVAAREGLKTIEWFESWLNGREEPVRYDPEGMQKHPLVFSVNYNARDVAEMKKFIQQVIDDNPGTS